MSNILQNLENMLAQSVSGTGTAMAGRQGASPMGALAQALGMGGGQSPARGNAAGPLSDLLGPAALGGLAGALFGDKGARSMAGGALLAGGGAYLWNRYKDQITSVYKEITGPGTSPETRGAAPRTGGQTYDLNDDFEPVPAAPRPQPGLIPGESPAEPATAPASAHAAARAAAPAQVPTSAHAAAQAASAAQAPASAHAAAQARQEPAADHAPSDLARRVITALVFAAKADGHIDATEQKAIADRMAALNLGPFTQDLVQQAMNAPLDPGQIADGLTDPELAMQLFMLSCAVIDVDHFMERSYLDALAQALRIPGEMKEEIESKVRALKA